MIARNQDQSGGANSTNLQTTGDINFHGASIAEMKEIALDVFRKNALELKGIAEDTAVSRAEKITNEFLKTMYADHPDQIKNLADPDIQSVLFESQREFSRSGEDDLGIVLADLLVGRTVEVGRSLRVLALNSAIESVAKLTEEQRRAIALVFALRYTRSTSVSTVDEFFEEHVGKFVLPLASGFPTAEVEYRHIEFVGAGTVSLTEAGMGHIFGQSAKGLFTMGFDRAEVGDELFAAAAPVGVIVPCLRDNSRFQVQMLAQPDLDSRIVENGLTQFSDDLIRLSNLNVMTESVIEAECAARSPELANLLQAWTNSSLKNLTLTSVGYAIGHAYWARATGSLSPLSSWLP